ncbi:MAG: peptidylprolyl isomerase [Opitutaceae bacterium]|nr:peptidylprolyl isomerase [Opitutaceae bacterium]
MHPKIAFSLIILSSSFAFLESFSAETTKADLAPVGARFSNGIVAIVEEKVITVGDVRREIKPLLPQIRSESRSEAEFRQKLEEVEDTLIQSLADEILIIKDFYSEEGRYIPPYIVENIINERLITQFDNERAKFHSYLQAIGKTPREYRKIVEEEIIVNWMRGQMRKSENIVSPVKIADFYEANKDRFYLGDGVHLRLIQLAKLADENDSVLMQTADNILKQLKDGTDFAKLAEKHSQNSSRKKGGDMGWVNRSDLKEELAESAFSLEEGHFSQPIQIGQDVFIILVEEKRSAGLQPIAEVSPQIERYLLSKMAGRAEETWLQRLRRNAYIRYFN